MPSSRLRCFLSAFVLAPAACSAPLSVPVPPPAQSPSAPSSPSATPSPLPPPPPAAAAVATPDPALHIATFHRELEAAVTALAVERPPFATAVTRDSVWMHEAPGWHEEKLPPSAQGAAFAVFYGRDDRVRLVGSHGAAAPGIYFRWKPGGFRDAPYELGKLAVMPRPLVSVLGNDDPEIVCQPGEQCVVKRRTGWRFLEAPADIRWVTLGEGVGWAIAGQQLLRLGEHWEPVGPPGEWQQADALFATRDRAWVVETAAGRVYAFDGTRWQTATSPVERPHAIWGARGDALWLVGDGGLGFSDGATWRPVADAPKPLAAVAGRGAGEVWVGGEHGLFRVELRR
jgi:hypothetical protein